MDHKSFDVLTRQVAREAGTRRGLLRLLAVSALTSAATHLGLTGVVAAKAKKHGKRKTKHPSNERVHAAGKGHKKKHKDKRHSPPSPAAKLCDAYCDEGGGRCCHGECIDANACCAPEEQQCSDGSCYGSEFCCPDQRRCGNTCVAGDACCDDERPCGDSCLPLSLCCDGEHKCADGMCLRNGLCCPSDPDPDCDSCSDVVCIAGKKTCVSRCQTDDAVCCGGQCLSPCSNGCDVSDDCRGCNKAPAGQVFCAAMNVCVSSGCSAGQAFDPATCSCQDVCPPSRVCGEGCCPEGMSCESGHVAVCCNEAGHCQCASGYTGGCNGQCCKNGCCSGRCCPS